MSGETERDQPDGHGQTEGGETEGAERPCFKTINPATGEAGRAYDGHCGRDVEGVIDDVAAAFQDWRGTPFSRRAELMHAAAAVLRRRKLEFARLMTAEMGKTQTEGEAEIEKCAVGCSYFADHAEGFLSPEPIDMGGPKAFVTFNPLGPILAVMPWNFPFWQVFRFAAPNLMAGNVGLLKHASNVPGCALAIEDVLREARFPDHVFRTLLIPSRDVAAVIRNPKVAAVTLTGSVEAGRRVAETAGACLKKTVLELGGSDAYIVLEDADLGRAAEICAAARMVNAGQSCIAGKRFIVVRQIREAFERALAAQMDTYVIGDPASRNTKLGPLQSIEARNDIHAQVKQSLDKGARLLTGGEVPDRPGAWYAATVLTDVRPGMPAYDEEVFGPVAAVIEARDEAEAIRIANASPFGLGSGVITRDLARGERIAAEALEAGMSFVNEPVRSDPRLPFGGVKDSGYGREVSQFGIREFTNVKSVLVREM